MSVWEYAGRVVILLVKEKIVPVVEAGERELQSHQRYRDCLLREGGGLHFDGSGSCAGEWVNSK